MQWSYSSKLFEEDLYLDTEDGIEVPKKVAFQRWDVYKGSTFTMFVV